MKTVIIVTGVILVIAGVIIFFLNFKQATPPPDTKPMETVINPKPELTPIPPPALITTSSLLMATSTEVIATTTEPVSIQPELPIPKPPESEFLSAAVVVPPPPKREAQEFIIKIYSAIRAEPASLSVYVGDTVTFINEDDDLHWPGADPHPTHSSLPTFDALGGISKRQSYSHTFRLPGEFGYHEHLLDQPPTVGIISVLP